MTLGIVQQAIVLLSIVSGTLALLVLRIALSRASALLAELDYIGRRIVAEFPAEVYLNPALLRSELLPAIEEDYRKTLAAAARPLPEWLRPQLLRWIRLVVMAASDQRDSEQFVRQWRPSIFSLVANDPLAYARGELLLACVGTLIALIGLWLVSTGLALFAALGAFVTVVGLQVTARAVRDAGFLQQAEADVLKREEPISAAIPDIDISSLVEEVRRSAQEIEKKGRTSES